MTVICSNLYSDTRLPIYQRLAETLRREIIQGQRRPGHKIPSENKLAVQYKVSPGTVRRCLSELVDEGLFERIHGKGTFVRSPNFNHSFMRFFRVRDIDGSEIIPESKILKREYAQPSSTIAKTLGIPEAQQAIYILRLRILNNTVLFIEQIWLSSDRFVKLMEIPIEEIGTLLYPIYESSCNQLIARADENLTVSTASVEIAKLLKVTSGTPVVVINRIARGYDDTPLEYRQSYGRADCFHYNIEIR